MKVLVTGATGFIGNHVIYSLLQNPNVEVIATSRNIEKAQAQIWFSKVKYLPYDLDSTEEQNLFSYFGNPDAVIHLAWDGLPNYNDLIHIEKNLNNNYRFLKNLVANGLKNISISGTCFEYGMIDGCLKENIQTNPSNTYAIAKDSLRKFAEELNKQFKFDLKWIRLFYMYGEGQSKSSILSQLEQAVLNKDKVFNMSGGEQLRDYLKVEDVADYIVKISLQNKINGIINCCKGEPISIRRLVENYLSKQNYNINLNLGYYPYASYEPMAFWGCNKKLKEACGG